MNEPLTYIVTGPMACGKTHHRHEIARYLVNDENAIVDDWDLHLRPLVPGHVHLTNLPIEHKELRKRSTLPSVRIVTFEAVMAELRGENSKRLEVAQANKETL